MTSSIKKNFAYQMIYEILALILPLITSPYIARVIGARGLGEYSYSYSVAYYFVLFSMLGINNYGNRIIAQTRDNPEKLQKTFSDILAVHVVASLICCIFYVVYVLSLQQDKIYPAIQGIYVVSGLFDISWFYFGIEKFKMTVIRNTIVKLLNVICVFAFVRSENDLGIYCAIMAIGTLLGHLLLWFPLRKYVRIVRPDIQGMRTHIKPLVILFFPAIAVSLYKYMDKIMIGSINGKEQLGFYENAEKVVNIVLSIISAFGTVMLPRMSNLLQLGKKDMAIKYIRNSMRYVMCLAFALAFGLAAVGHVFALIFWGSAFCLSGTLIMGLAVIIPFFSFASVIRTQYLIPAGRDREYLISIFAGAAVNLCVNWTLIPSMGALGATIGTIAAEAMVCCMQIFFVRKEMEIRYYLVNSIPFLIVGVIMFIPVYILGSVKLASIKILIAQILLGAFIYVITCVLYFYYIKDEIFISLIYNIFSKKENKKGG